MKQFHIITIALLCLFLLAPCLCQDLNTPNFEGSFDSMNPHDVSNNDEEENQDSEYGEEEDDIMEFSENLGEFIPDETFTFKMKPDSQQSFSVWPGSTVQSIRGMFHCQLDTQKDQEYQQGGYVDLTLMDGNSLVREYKQQRLGVFKHPYNLKDNRIQFFFTSGNAPVEVYFSYEVITAKKNQNKETNVTDLTKVSRTFQRVSGLLLQQQKQMQRLMEIGSRHTNHMQTHLNQLWWRAVIEALALLVCSLVSLWMLKKQIHQGYQLLV